MTTTENYQCVLNGESRLVNQRGKWELPFDFVASLFTNEQWEKLRIEGMTRFESLAIYSIREALSHTRIDVKSARTCLIISTTKANIELISTDAQKTAPAIGAQHIASNIGVTTEPIVVCNACISGTAAIILAQRLLQSGDYDTSIVCGCDVVGELVTSGFQSLKALSPEPCHPFDIERIGLNLGEAAATIILSNSDDAGPNTWKIAGGAIRNDTFHITTPSPKGKGCTDAIKTVLENCRK